jgi:hypothetical protein
MTGFFLAGTDRGKDEIQETAYQELRERSALAIGCPATERRIFKVSCRFEGHDCEIEVGQALPSRDGLVTAILDHGREEAFVVHTTDIDDGPVRLPRRVYSVTEFS